MNRLTNKKIPFVLAIGALLSGCNGSSVGQLSFDEQFEYDKGRFEHWISADPTEVDDLPDDSNAVYLGSVGMVIDLDGFTQSPPTDPGEDFRASNRLRIYINFAETNPTISGQIDNFVADEGHDLSGVLNIDPSTLSGSQFTLTTSGDLDLDGGTLSVINGLFSGGAIMSDGGQIIWADFNADTSYVDGIGGPVLTGGDIEGGLIGQLQTP